MRVVILAAGQGTRLRPHTNHKPKCMVELCGKSLVDYQLEAFKKAGINDVTVVAGYCEDKLVRDGVKKILNPRFASTNMVSTLMCARDLFDGKDDVLITYGDIVYQQHILDAILEAEGHLTLTIDKEWRRLWSLRMENPLEDAETLKLDGDKIIELGKKPTNYDQIQGQYMGLIKVSSDKAKELIQVWESMDRKAVYDGKDFDNMYLTSFIQHLIDIGWPVKAVPVENGWLEIDTVDDLEYYEQMINTGLHTEIFKKDCRE
ncbi:NTP transferase domain-containing protein [Rheinheimera maricola]|uniref:Phosphocholine cytidylyltransferase family protein n=1 Tax=Rheinheimera maricola TaxID=2793282 RepID=A0ABS7X437_9GAMM|nr:phosphocholine cytidylyltransferase family protein [Rheinheimera maricola]MBZ9610323.1 phosphocholine cytidylyltransferase family protein [Rheinheimera maricola]